MPITLDLSTTASTDVQFVVSPLVELGSVWHVLIGHDHHQAQVRVPSDLLCRLEDWSFAVRAVRATLLVDPTLIPPATWKNQLAGVSRLPAERFASAMLRPLLRARGRSASLADDRVRAGVLGLARARGPAAMRVVQRTLQDPEGARADFVELLGQCWSGFFGAEWGRVFPRLRDDAQKRSGLNKRYGWARALAGLPESIVAEPAANRIVIDKVQNKRLTVRGRGLILMGTALCDGHVYVADEPGRPIIVQYPMVHGHHADVRATLRRLTVLANPARMEVARAIAVEPRSAKEIARLWGMAESAVTKHLSALRAAGLVHTEQAGHFVRYTLDSEAFAALGTDLLEVLRR